jgi:hypothetical protein
VPSTGRRFDPVPSFRVEPVQLGTLAGRFGELVADFEAVPVSGLGVGETGDTGLTEAIERFVEWSQGNVAECSDQFSQLQRLLTAAAHGYENVERHVVDEITENLSPEGDEVTAAVVDKAVRP